MELSSATGFSGLSVSQIGAGRECFAEIEDLGKTHFLCDACEAEKAEQAKAQKDKLVKAGQQVKAKVAEPVLDEAMDAVKKAIVRKAVPVAGKAVKKVIK